MRIFFFIFFLIRFLEVFQTKFGLCSILSLIILLRNIYHTWSQIATSLLSMSVTLPYKYTKPANNPENTYQHCDRYESILIYIRHKQILQWRGIKTNLSTLICVIAHHMMRLVPAMCCAHCTYYMFFGRSKIVFMEHE